MAVSRYYRATSVATYLNVDLAVDAIQLIVNGDAKFPTSYPFTVILNRNTSNEEVLQIDSLVSVAGAVYTYNVTRGTSVEPTMAAKAHSAGSIVEHGVSARDFRESRQHEDATAAHGATGSVVGTTNNQTLQNKTLDETNNISQTAVTGLATSFSAKANLDSPTFSGTVSLPATTSIGTVSNTEISYLDGVTSGIQGQIAAVVSDVDAVEADILGLDSAVSTAQTTANRAAPTGVVQAYLGTSAPTGWLLCNGDAVSRTGFAALFTLFGTRYGVGDNTTTFNLPDLRSRFIRGAADTASLSGSVAGADTHTHTGSAISSGGHTHSYSGTVAETTSGIREVASGTLNTPQYAHTHTFSGVTSTSGVHSHTLGIDSGSNIPTHIAVNWIVKI